MAKLAWGKPRILVKDLEDPVAQWITLPTPVKDSTQLTPTAGEKQEAQLEGGDNEDVRYGYNNYAMAFNIRAAKDRKRPISDFDGVVDHKYAVALQPEDPEAPGFAIEIGTVSVQESYNANDGSIWAYTVDALKPENGHRKVTFGKIIITEELENVSKVEIEPEDETVAKFEIGAAEE